MAQQRPRLHRHRPPVVPPRYTLRQVVWAVVGFLLLISILVAMTTPSSSSTSSSVHTDADGHGKRSYRSPNDIPLDLIMSLDAILVLGGGVPESIDKPPIYVQRRCDDAVVVSARYHDYHHLHHHSSSSSSSSSRKKTKKADDDAWLPILCLSAGTAHLPQLIGPDGYPIWESTASANYILRKTTQQQQDDGSRGLSLPSDHVFVETTSYDTIGNAYFTRTAHTDINGWRNLLVVTDEFHMDRTKLIFDWIFGAAHGGRSSDESSSLNDYKLTYLSTPNVGLSEQAVTARTEREQSSAMNLRTKIIPNYSSLHEIYTFITQEHSLYNAAALSKRGRGGGGTDSVVDIKIKQSYGVATGASGGGENGSAS